MKEYVYECSAKGCGKTYRSPIKLSTAHPPTHEHKSAKVHTMEEVSDGKEKASSA
jgi:hypothetical protein